MKSFLTILLLFFLVFSESLNAQSCTAQIGGLFGAACRYQTMTIYAVNQAPGALYNWTIPAGVTLLQNNGASVKLYFPNQGNYWITLQQSCPFTMSNSSVQGFVFVNFGTLASNPNMSISGPDTVQAGVATNFSFYWNSVPLGPGTNNAWILRYATPTSKLGSSIGSLNPGSSGTHTDIAPVTLDAQYSTGKFGLAVVPANACGDTVYKTVHVVGAMDGPAVNCVGDIVTYTLPSGTANTWTVIGGTILSGQSTNTIQVQWNTVGTDSVYCNWTYGSFGTQTTKRKVIVGTSVTPTIAGSLTLCNATQTYSTTNTPNHSYRWTVNGVNRSYTNNLTLVADNQPMYSIALYDSIGTCVTTTNLVIPNLVYPHPVISATGNPCQYAPITLSVASIPGATYTWNAAGGTILSGAGTNSVSVLYNTSANVTPSVVVNVSGCSRTATLPLGICPAILPNLGPNTSTCPGVPLNLTNSNYISNFITSYSCNAGLLGGSNFTVPGPGTYWVSANVNHSVFTCSTRDTVVVASSTSVGTDLGPDIPLCGAPTVTISPTTVGSVGPYSYLWSTGATTASINVPVGTYSVTVSAAGYCDEADTIEVLAPAMPFVSLTPFSQTVCPGTSTVLDAGPGYASYIWSTGATTQSITVTAAGTYSVTATDAMGCLSSASTTLNHYATPSLILGADTTICPDTFAVLNSATFISYLWSNAAITQSIQAPSAGTYSVTVLDVNGCVWSDTALVSLNTDCIWPGDANHDGLANNFDILDIGFAMAATGAIRLNASTSWYGQVANNWTLNFPSLLNFKHADCDGDGIVTYPDTLIVIQNYGLSHNKSSGATSGPSLQFVPLQPSFSVGDTVEIGIHLGDAGNQAVGVNGLAYSVNVGGITTNPGDVWFTFPAGFMGAIGTDELAVAFEDVLVGQHDLAQARLGISPVNGYGQIAIMHIRTDSLLLPNAHNPLSFSFAGVWMVDDSLQSLPLATISSSMDVQADTTVGVVNPQNLRLQVYPVPADQVLHVRCVEDALALEVQLFDLAGHLCKQMAVDGQSADLPVGELSEGTYLMAVIQAGRVIQHAKVTVLHR